MSLEELHHSVEEVKQLIRFQGTSQQVCVFINAQEVERILAITRPTVLQLLKDELLTDYSAESTSSTNKYLLGEVLWLQGHKYKGISPRDIVALKEIKSIEFSKPVKTGNRR